jgi:hypothetical protein
VIAEVKERLTNGARFGRAMMRWLAIPPRRSRCPTGNFEAAMKHRKAVACGFSAMFDSIDLYFLIQVIDLVEDAVITNP